MSFFHYFALPLGNGNGIGQDYQAGVISAPRRYHDFTTFAFNDRSHPILFAAMQTANDEDPATMRYDNLVRGSVAIAVQEETSSDPETNHGGESIRVLMIDSPVPNRRLLWYEPFSLDDNTTDDAGSTAWEVVNRADLATGANLFEVQGAELTAQNTNAEMIWRSEEVPISGYSNVKIAVDVRSEGPLEADDYLYLYYKVDGGPEIPLTNGLHRSEFDETTAMAGGLSGEQVRIVARVKNNEGDEHYFIDDVRVYTESDERYAIQSGNWNDPTTWSYTPGGPTCSCRPDPLSNTYIDGYTVTMDQDAYTHNLTVFGGSTLNSTVNDLRLRLYGDATLDVKSGGRVNTTGSSSIHFTQWNSRDLDHDEVRSGVGLAGVDITINVDDPAGLQVHDISFDAAGEYTFQGNGNINLADDLDVNNEAEINNNLSGELSIGSFIFLGYTNTTLTNNGRLVVNDDLLYQQDNIHFINRGDFETNVLRISKNRSGLRLTNESGGTVEVKSVTDLESSEFTIDNHAIIEMAGDIVNVEANEGLFYNRAGAVWKFGGENVDDDLQLFANYTNNEFHYNGTTDQSIITPQDAYWHLTLSNKNSVGTTISVKTPTTTHLDINGNFTMVGTENGIIEFKVNGTDTDINIAGDWWHNEQSGSNTVRFIEGSVTDNEIVIFDGTSDQRIPADEEYIRVEIDKPSGQVLVENSSRILGPITFTEGIVVAMNNNPFILREDAQALQASDASHIVGPVVKQGTTNFTFPIGDGTRYRPVGISELSESANFTAEYHSAPAPNASARPDNLLNLAPCGYWSLSRDPNIGNTQANVTLFWDSNCPVDGAKVVIARWNPTAGQWLALESGLRTGDASSGSITSAVPITDFGTPGAPALFTLAELPNLPQAYDDQASTTEDTDLTTNLLANDTDDEGLNPASVTIVNSPSHGIAFSDPVTGLLTYSPEDNFFGTDQLTYTVQNNQGLTSSPATLTITVTSVNDAPVALDDQATTPFRTILNSPSVLTNDTDPVEGHSLTATLLTQPDQGTLTFFPDGSYAFAPGQFYGTTSYTYQVCDNGHPVACDTATVTITVRSPEVINQAPVAKDDQFTTPEDMSLTANVLTNDLDPDGDFLVVTLTPVRVPERGTVVFSDNGTLVYTPTPDFFGTDQLIYEVCDNAGACDTAALTIYVAPVNDAPTALADTFATAEAQPVLGNLLANDYDIDQDTLTVSLLLPPASGTVSLMSDGGFTYTPDDAFTGHDQFTYQLCDGQDPVLCSEASVTLVVSAMRTLQIPKGFSPNGDGINDTWVVPGIRAYPNNQVTVFNRWGNIVYKVQGYDNIDTVWAGQTTQGVTLGSADLPDGTYFYLIRLTSDDSQSDTQHGYMILKR